MEQVADKVSGLVSNFCHELWRRMGGIYCLYIPHLQTLAERGGKEGGKQPMK